jgi:hypothetical protein
VRQRLVARCRSGNKAKLGRAGVSGGQRAGGDNSAKRTQLAARRPGPSGLVVQTNRIRQGRSCRTNPIRRRIVRNEPNLPIADCGSGTDWHQDPPCDLPPRASPGGSYKQSQLAAGLWCKTKPISTRGRGLGDEGVLYKQTQFRHVARASHAPDQAGPRLCAGADFARGSESWARRPCYYMPIRRSAFPGGQIVQNEPNLGGEIPRRSTILSFHHSNPMPIVQNEPNFPSTLPGVAAGFFACPRGRGPR